MSSPADSYRSIRSLSEGIYREKGSRFLAFATPVHSQEEAMKFLQQIRSRFHDARHHCYAWVIGQDKKLIRASDDGEPQGTAGKPILSQIEAFDLRDVMIIVVRYFGGTLLGTGGLSRAYRTAARDALGKAEIIDVPTGTRFRVRFPYSAENAITRIIHEEKITVLEKKFDVLCIFDLLVPRGQTDSFFSKTGKIPGVFVAPA